MNKVIGSKGVMTAKSNVSYFEWEIPKFCTECYNVGDIIESPVFTHYFSTVTYWRLQLYPKGETIEDKEWLSLYLIYVGKKQIKVNAILSILDDKYNKVVETNMEEKTYDEDSGWGEDKFIKIKYILDCKNRILEDGKLRIICKMIFNPDFILTKTDTQQNNNVKFNVSTDKFEIVDDLEKLFKSELYSDVTINVGENKLRAHKAIITSRSPVFDAMFKCEMKEKENNTIVITDVSYDVMKEVLCFMYTSKVNNIETISSDLLIAAEKYSVEGLKTLCAQSLYETCNFTNAIEILKVADLCNADMLKSQMIEFISYNQKAITEKPEFDLFGDLNSKLQCELVRALAAHNLVVKLK